MSDDDSCTDSTQVTVWNRCWGAPPRFPPTPRTEAPSSCGQSSLWLEQHHRGTCLCLIPLLSCLLKCHQVSQLNPSWQISASASGSGGTWATTTAPQTDPCSPTTTHKPLLGAPAGTETPFPNRSTHPSPHSHARDMRTHVHWAIWGPHLLPLPSRTPLSPHFHFPHLPTSPPHAPEQTGPRGTGTTPVTDTSAE